MNLSEAIKNLQSGKITSYELTQNCLERIEHKDKDIGSMLFVDAKKSLQNAKSSDERRKNNMPLSELDGVPITLKDMIITSDMPTTAASNILSGYVAPYDAFITKKLKNAGAVILGKNNQDEFAMGSSNENSAFKLCKNPHDLTKTPGGSSGGSAAAVASDFCFGSLGTDTGGSVRQPASYCGIVGIKPTYGRVSRFGIIAFASSLDQVGVLAKDIAGSAYLLKAISGYDENDATSANVKVPDFPRLINKNIEGKKIGIPKEFFAEGLNSEVASAVENCIKLLEKNKAKIVDISLPHTKYAVATYYIIATAEASSNLARYDGIRYGQRRGDNKNLSSLYEETRGELFGDEVKKRILLGTYVLSSGYYDAYYLRAQKVRRLFSMDFKNAFENIDVILSPTTPTTAFNIGEKIKDPVSMYLNDIYTISANLAGLPGISMPCGKDKNNLPIGVQLMANRFEEQQLFDIGAFLESEFS